MNNLKHIPDNVGLAFKLAQRFALQGADDLFVQQFNRLLASGDYAGAARVAGGAPGTLLRNQETINKFKNLPQTGGPHPILVYFSTLLETCVLNDQETIELGKIVLPQGKINLIQDWIKQGKLTLTDAFGDLVGQFDKSTSLAIFQQSGSPDKVLQGLIETGKFDQIMPYCQRMNHTADFIKILRGVLPVNPKAAVDLAKMITSREGNNAPKAQIDQVVQVFLEQHKV